ncbi:hypothetical protein [Natronosalvus vescus]|uniref:hypothetical protein n=1 Tax=Natronosalvus vescus TaxID=2953881 RepID=UPI0020915497|nr:hypothetical protein [Natronosalvus vescus]
MTAGDRTSRSGSNTREGDDGMDTENEREEDWPDPSPGIASAIDRRGLAVRLVCAVGVLIVLLVLTRGFLDDSLALLWTPTEPLAQWSMLVMLHAFGYVLVPLMVGSFLADLLLEYVLETPENDP